MYQNHQLRRLFSDNIFLYKLYHHVYRKRKGLKPAFFTKKTKFFFDGYQRSGNTYLVHLVQNFLSAEETVHHLHKVAPIKIALKGRTIVFIIFRNPLDSIPSAYLKYFEMRHRTLPSVPDNKVLKNLIYDYLYYYKFVLQNSSKINLIDFKALIENPELTLKGILTKINPNFVNQEFDNMLKGACNSYIGATSDLGSSKPSRLKDNLKKPLKKRLTELPGFSSCQILYEHLLEITKT